jgi:hypothetical protein
MTGRARAMGATGRGLFVRLGINILELILFYSFYRRYILVYIKKFMSMKPNPKEIKHNFKYFKGGAI